MGNPYVLYNIFQNNTFFCFSYLSETICNVCNIKYEIEKKFSMPCCIVDNSNIVLKDLAKIYQCNFQSHLVTCICGSNNAVSLNTNFTNLFYLIFCLDIVDYNNTSYLSYDQLYELKRQTLPLLKTNIKVFNFDYELSFIICFKGTSHFISYLIKYPYNNQNLKSNNSYLYTLFSIFV